MKLYGVKFNETFNNWKDHISIKDAFSGAPPTIRLEWKHSLEPGIKTWGKVGTVGGPETGGDGGPSVPGNPDFLAGGKKLTEGWVSGDQHFMRTMLLSVSSIKA